MGSPVGVLIDREKISLDHLAGKTIAIDAFNALYQFLAIIRLRDGSPLRDRSGRITSHLSGLFNRTVNLLEHGIKPVYIFDGKPPDMKRRTILEREVVKAKFEKEWKVALEKGDLPTAFKKSVMTSRLDRGMLEDAWHLLDLMGIPWVRAPSEGEAQAAVMTREGYCYGAASQDYDALLFGSPRLIINLTVAGKRYYPRRGIAISLIPELVILEKALSKIELRMEQLIDIALIVGTDFNDGIFGVGPKGALHAIKRYGNLEAAATALGWKVDFDAARIRGFYLSPPASVPPKLSWSQPSYDELREFLVEGKSFEQKRVTSVLERLRTALRAQEQVGLSGWT